MFNKSHFISQLEPFQWFSANHFTFYFSLELFSGVTWRSRLLVNNFFHFYQKFARWCVWFSVLKYWKSYLAKLYIYTYICVCVYKCRLLQRRDVAIQSSHKDIDALNLTSDTYNRDSNMIYCRVIIWCQTRQTKIQAKQRAPVRVDHFLYSHDLNIWVRSETVRRN